MFHMLHYCMNFTDSSHAIIHLNLYKMSTSNEVSRFSQRPSLIDWYLCIIINFTVTPLRILNLIDMFGCKFNLSGGITGIVIILLRILNLVDIFGWKLNVSYGMPGIFIIIVNFPDWPSFPLTAVA